MSITFDSPAGTCCEQRYIPESKATPRRKDVDLATIERAVRTILTAVGEDPDRPGLKDTPRRVARMYKEMFSGLHTDPARHLHVTFPEDYDEMVL
ncbi:MAG: GTP cyclohydrolase I, partial [Methylotetracoccus sp.]|nr:GTP cyclohydrolase I [Methylotetracoccus sp.]